MYCTLFNARSIRNKSDFINQFIIDSKCDIVSITETWLTDNDSTIPAFVVPNGCNMICHNRGTSRGSGIAIIYNSHFNIKNNILPNFTSREAISYRLLNTSSFIDIILIYRPPSL